jgi:hypothetical protein
MTRLLGQAASRRAVAGVLLASALQVLPGADAEDKQRRRKERRRKRQDRRQDRRPGNAPTTCDVCERGCRYASLQPAIDAAKAGDTIRICAGDYPSNRSVIIGRNLTLVGDGAAKTFLKGGGFVRVLDLAPNVVVTLRDLTVRGGVESQAARGGGGGILVRNAGTLTLEHCRVEGNTAPTGGGIGLRPASALTLIESDVIDNAATSGGGGIYVDEGATARLQAGSRVGDNSSTVFGGGVDIVAGTVVLESGASITGNEASQLGGGISASTRSTVTLEAGSHVSGNSAGQDGGGLHHSGATVSIADASIVTDNDPNNCGGRQTANCVG